MLLGSPLRGPPYLLNPSSEYACPPLLGMLGNVLLDGVLVFKGILSSSPPFFVSKVANAGNLLSSIPPLTAGWFVNGGGDSALSMAITGGAAWRA